MTSPKASIVVPVYNAIEESIECLESILASDAAGAEIIVLDDGSDAADADLLNQRFSGDPSVKILRHFRNRGYTRNVQYGVEVATSPFVCVLNSDVMVPNRWLDRLLSALTENSRMAAVGPLSNAASWQSVPRVHDEYGVFTENGGLGLSTNERNSLNSTLEYFFGDQLEVVPLLNGFCTIFRRSALLEVGGFDTAAFPNGYGEENDLCARLGAHSYQLAVCPSVFVHHRKSRSFGVERKTSLSNLGARALANRYGPDFMNALARVCQDSKVLGLARELTSQHQEIFLAHTAEPEYPTSLGQFSGPSCIEVSRSGISELSPSDEMLDGLELSQIDAGTFQIKIPPGYALDYLHGAPAETILISLAIQSQMRGISIVPSDFSALLSIPFRLMQLSSGTPPA